MTYRKVIDFNRLCGNLTKTGYGLVLVFFFSLAGGLPVALAYAVQVEEDLANQELLALLGETDLEDIRERDDYWAETADAQAGRVLKDQAGNWTRVQQYVLQPDPKTVLLLGATLRGSDADHPSGLSILAFTATLATDYDGDLRDLPWSLWLNTQDDFSDSALFEDEDCDGSDLAALAASFGAVLPSSPYDAHADFHHDGKVENDDLSFFVLEFGRTDCPSQEQERIRFITTTMDTPALSHMQVELKNHLGESLTESRTFGPRVDGVKQFLVDEYLSMASGEDTLHEYVYGEHALASQYCVADQTDGQFHYALGESAAFLDVMLFVADDYGNATAMASDQVFHDLWDTLRSNEPEGPPIGNNSLEISIISDGDFFNTPLDVFLIPMTRMLWKDDQGD